MTASVVVMLCLTVSSAACGSEGDGGGGQDEDPSTTTSSSVPDAGLASTSWVLAYWASPGDPATTNDAVAPASLDFSDGGQLNGSTGCNTFGAGWEIEDGSLTIAMGPMTLAGCVDPLVADQEQAVVSALEATSSYTVDADTLALLDPEGNTLLEYAAVSDDLAGTSWRATGINNGTGGVEANASTPLAMIEFSEDGTASGTGGCNEFTATWATEDRSISITDLSITEMSCGPELDALEQQLIAALTASSTYAVSGSTLELRDDAGAIQVTFEPTG